jgi:hypothetical protein
VKRMSGGGLCAVWNDAGAVFDGATWC